LLLSVVRVGAKFFGDPTRLLELFDDLCVAISALTLPGRFQGRGHRWFWLRHGGNNKVPM
jgi:hypothetical protein